MVYFVGCCYLHSGNVQVLPACVSHVSIRLHQLRRFERIAVSNLIPLQTPTGPELSRHPRNSQHIKKSLQRTIICHTQQRAGSTTHRRHNVFFSITLKADSHIACRDHSVPLPCSAINSHIPCRAPALLRQCHVLHESLRGSRKYPNC